METYELEHLSLLIFSHPFHCSIFYLMFLFLWMYQVLLESSIIVGEVFSLSIVSISKSLRAELSPPTR